MANRFSVREAFSYFRLVDNVTGREARMGDGTDTDIPHPIGSPEFCEAWERDLNIMREEIFQAYFPDLYNLMIFDNDDFTDRYTVILNPASSLERSMQKCASLHNCLGLSTDPDSPQGFSQWGTADPEFMAERNERVHFLDLPENIQRHIGMRLEED